MPSKKKILKKFEKSIKNQNKNKQLERWERVSGKELDPETAPGLEVIRRLRKGWKTDEKGRELSEEGTFTNEGDVEKEEESGEEPYPEIEAAEKDPDEEEEN
jgi:hypothetical protein